MSESDENCVVSTTGPPQVFVSGVRPAIRFKRPAGNELDWLLRIWQFYRCPTKRFIVREADCEGWAALVTHLEEAQKQGHLDVWETEQHDKLSREVQLSAGTLVTFQEQTRASKPVRQITVDGRGFDLRNKANFDLAGAHIEDVVNATYGWLHEFRNTRNKRVKRAAMLTLTRVLLLRGRELPSDLYDTINLRLRGQLEDVADSVFDSLEKQSDGTYVSKGPTFQVRVTHESWT
jgi:hypothetical protein